MALEGDEGGKPLGPSQVVGFAQLPGKAVGDAKVPDLARLHHLVQPLQDVVQRGLIVPHVIDVEVDVVHTQVLQTLVHHPADVLLAADAVCDLLVGSGEEFGGHHHLLPPGKVPEGPAQVLFAGAALVTDGGVEEIDAALQALAEDGPAVRLIQGPGVLAVVGIAEAHAPHADARDPEVRVS